jgi:hypothetical protein
LKLARPTIVRIWTVHPKYLDRQGLLALWREGLLAQKVLRGLTRGYRAHPQLRRFLDQNAPVTAIAAYLREVRVEALRRGYRFAAGKIARVRMLPGLAETRGQLIYEWKHLRGKLRRRSPEDFARTSGIEVPDAHPLFAIVAGRVREWERLPAKPAASGTRAATKRHAHRR